MSEGIDKAALPMSSPWHLMIPNPVKAAVRTRRQGTSNERVWIVAEHLNSGRWSTEFLGSLPAVPLRFAEEDWRTINLDAHD
jgi:hypothetical protein